MPDKLTDSEIVKALEEWRKEIVADYQRLQLLDAPMDCFEESHADTVTKLSNALDLINRLQAEVNHLDNESDALRADIDFLDREKDKLQAENENYSKNNQQMTSDILKLYKELEQAKAENERLKETTKNMSAYVKGNGWGLISFVEFCKNLKAEAYKEFAERLKTMPKHYYFHTIDGTESLVSFDRIDNLLKEMVGD